MLPSTTAAGVTASGPAADNAAATVLTVGVAVAQLGGTDSFPTNVPEFEAVATTGVGVFDTLKAVAKLVLTELKRGG